MSSFINKKQQGFTLIEMSFVVAIASLLAIAAGMAMLDRVGADIATAGGDQLTEVMTAVNDYEVANRSALQNGTAITGFASPYAPTTAELRLANFLHNTSDTNAFGSQWAISIAKLPAGCLTSACSLQGLIVSNAPVISSQTQKIAYDELGIAAKRAGGNAGFSDDVTPGNISGPNAAWVIANPYNAAGYLGGRSLVSSSGNTIPCTAPNFAGLPLGMSQGALCMTTDNFRVFDWTGTIWSPVAVDQNGNMSVPGTVNAGAAVITGTATMTNAAITGVATIGAACAPNGLLAQNGAGLMLSCKNGMWLEIGKNANRVIITSSQNWTVPAGVTQVYVTLSGGGSSGGATTTSSFGGSSGGFLQGIPISVTPSQIIPVTIGMGGAGGGAPIPINGQPGGATSFGNFVQCSGGAAGSYSTVIPGAPGSCTGIAGYGSGYGVLGEAVNANSYSPGGRSEVMSGYGSGGDAASWGNGAQVAAWPGIQGIVIIEY